MMEQVEMTKDTYIERSWALMGLLATFVPAHTEQGKKILEKIYILQNVKFTD